ncbi:MAG: hypothetical protein LBK61_01030 [Spirochaetaceae bacterium]|jgi:hypothetical protein|nr:hypothetical protein [Spirochaetaceae bacterium]
MEDKISFNLVKHIGVLSEGKGGWRKELNLLSWNGRAPKYDIRDWGGEREKIGKGTTLSKEEALKLAALISAECADEPGPA